MYLPPRTQEAAAPIRHMIMEKVSTSVRPWWNAVSISCGKNSLEVMVAACCAGKELSTLAGMSVASGLYPRKAAKR